jgi:hypothetical protein
MKEEKLKIKYKRHKQNKSDGDENQLDFFDQLNCLGVNSESNQVMVLNDNGEITALDWNSISCDNSEDNWLTFEDNTQAEFQITSEDETLLRFDPVDGKIYGRGETDITNDAHAIHAACIEFLAQLKKDL